MAETEPIRVMIVDDDPASRVLISRVLDGCEDVRIVGSSSDGHRALVDVERLRPDVITLDLEMPQLGGFAFLRLLMARRPTPVVVISGQGDRELAFRALELGALDFVAKPGVTPDATILDLQARLLMCVRSVRRLTNVRVSQHAITPTKLAETPPPERPLRKSQVAAVACVVASTGGPGIIEAMLGELNPDFDGVVLIAQHMPARFTESFATRLDRRCAVSVREACDGEVLQRGHVLIAPGQRNVELEREGAEVIVRVRDASDSRQGMAALAPSGDLLMASAARVFGSSTCAVVLSG
ncbi:MAG: chemotaxis protein CheB, partial [Nannocystaceae bacterium]